jgi:hypothetical protein
VTLDQLFAAAAGGCQTAGCDHRHSGPLFLHPKCHMKAGTWTSVDPSSRTLRVTCKVCKKEVVLIQCGGGGS